MTFQREVFEQALRHPLDQAEFSFGARYEGKVRDNYTTADGRRILIVYGSHQHFRIVSSARCRSRGSS
ncbi:MAG: hypothetical protein QM756_28970 [Polyangiaceae bacterium]